jgi:hypothetical protein
MPDRDEPRATVTPLAFAANLAKNIKFPSAALQESWAQVLLSIEQSPSLSALGLRGTYAVAWIAALDTAEVITKATSHELFVARDRVYAQAAQRLEVVS